MKKMSTPNFMVACSFFIVGSSCANERSFLRFMLSSHYVQATCMVYLPHSTNYGRCARFLSGSTVRYA